MDDSEARELVAETWDLIGHDPDVMRSLLELGDAVSGPSLYQLG